METFTLAAAAGKSLAALPLLVAFVLVAVAAVPRMAGPDTPAGPSTQEQMMNQLRARSLNELGMPVVDGLRYRKSRIRDTQDAPTADNTTWNYFSTATSQSSLHPLGPRGCNLREIGKIDERTAGLVVAFGIRFRGLGGSSNPNVLTDIARLIDDAYLESLTLDKIMLFEDVPLVEMARNLGATPLLAGGHTAFQMDGVAAGQPGFPDIGYALEPYERFTVIGGQELKATFKRSTSNAGTVLNAVRQASFELITVQALPARS